MNRDRFERPPFCFGDWAPGLSDEAKNRLFFDWWCDDEDRAALIGQFNGQALEVPSRTPYEADPAPPLSLPAVLGFRDRPLVLLSDPRDIAMALTQPQDFSNKPYADLGGGSFLLAMDPLSPGAAGTDWHGEQRALITACLQPYTQAPAMPPPGSSPLQLLAEESVRQASLTTLVRDEFDVAALAEQAALRYFGQLYGFAVPDHGVLEDASRAVYRALQYVAVGQHFVTEPALLPLARQAMGRLIGRCSDLMESYQWLARSPRRHVKDGKNGKTTWSQVPSGVVPWSTQCFSGLGKPLLLELPRIPSPLSGRDRAAVVANLLAGTVGNIVSAACLAVDGILGVPGLAVIRAQQGLAPAIAQAIARRPPLPVVPRRTRGPVMLPSGMALLGGTDCLVLLEALGTQPGCPHAFGRLQRGPAATHACLGEALTQPLLHHLVEVVLSLPLLRHQVDPLTGCPLPLERLWGFGCTRLPLLHDRTRRPTNPARRGTAVARRFNLIVPMRVRSPVGHNAAALRRLIAGAVPRVDQVLEQFGAVVHAWFEFSDGDTHLVLRTIYEGDFDAYMEHFAVNAGDLFDALFEHLEDAPPMPVSEFPDEFVETIRRFNRAPVAGYLYGA